MATAIFTAANFRSGRVEAYKRQLQGRSSCLAACFVDTRIPAGYAPFNVQELAGQLYVSYAKAERHPARTTWPGLATAFVDVFTNDGAFVKRPREPGAS